MDSQLYRGKTACPTDFWHFWQEAITEVFDAPLVYSSEKTDFVSPEADCYHLRFQSFDGGEIYAKYLAPKNKFAKKAAMLAFHGYTWNSGSFTAKLPYVGLGYSVFAMDCRGQGGLSFGTAMECGNDVFGHITRGIEQAPKGLYYRKLFLDGVMLARVAMEIEQLPEERLCVTGDSQGGALALVCGALLPKISKIAVYYPFLCDYEFAIKSGIIPSAYEEIRDYFKRVDPRHTREDAFYHSLGYIDVKNFTSAVEGAVLWFAGGMDTYCPLQSQMAAYHGLNGEKELIMYPEYGHEIMPDSLDLAYQFFLDF